MTTTITITDGIEKYVCLTTRWKERGREVYLEIKRDGATQQSETMLQCETWNQVKIVLPVHLFQRKLDSKMQKLLIIRHYYASTLITYK